LSLFYDDDDDDDDNDNDNDDDISVGDSSILASTSSWLLLE
jgi:hypothetical protein